MLGSYKLWRDVLQLNAAVAFDVLRCCHAWDKSTAVKVM